MNKFFIFFSIVLGSLTASLAQAQITLPQFKQVTAAFLQAHDEDIRHQNAQVLVNYFQDPKNPDYWWNLNISHASYSSYTDPKNGFRTHHLFLFGGYARSAGMTADGVALTLCHELGHGVGGAPFKDKESANDDLVSNEGQSDYFATRYCLEKVFKYLPPAKEVAPVSEYVDKLCQDYSANTEELTFCYRAFQALEVERIFLKTQPPMKDVSYETPDQSIVDKINTSSRFYPQAQCRLDTMVAGVLKQERPRCWWAP